MQYKTTNKLFRGIYQYKIVLVVPGSGFFRADEMEFALKNLQKIAFEMDSGTGGGLAKRVNIKNSSDLEYALELLGKIKKLQDYDLRVESPFVSIYTNSQLDVDLLTNIDCNRVKYISKPPTNNSLVSGTILLPKVNFDYKVTLSKTTYEHSTFVNWATGNKKVKMTKSCIRDLIKDRSWGGTYFYITGDSQLLMAKMHLGSAINKVERIIKA
jgi:hypothetical protein